VKCRRCQWIWYFFIIISVGTVSSFSFVGKFNPKNAEQPKPQAIQLFWPEKDCDPRLVPCAALARDKALVARLYPLAADYRLLLRSQGLDEAALGRCEALWLDESGMPLGAVALLRPAQGGGMTGDLRQMAGARTLRISLQYQGQTLVADMPL
jgi:hypothetical protein